MGPRLLVASIVLILFFMSRQMFPRGIRNNNPGNIRENGTRWQGRVAPTDQIAPMKDSAFVVFSSVRWGLRAMARAILNKIGRGTNTITGIVTEWAPPFENNTAEYIKRVVSDTGISASTVLKHDQVPAVMASMINVENGDPSPGVWVTNSQLVQAVMESGV